MKNLLIEYKGGGFIGCYWQWNYCYYDKKGDFHNIFSSGYKGNKTAEDMFNYMNNTNYEQDIDYFIYDLSKIEDVKDFVTNSNAGNILTVAKWLSINQSIHFKGKCDECGEDVEISNCFPEGFRGAGGIAIEATELICEDCYCSYTCVYCGEYYGSEENFNEEGYCSYCKNKF